MLVQAAPSVERCHCVVTVRLGPFQVPVLAVSVCRRCGVPETTGRIEFTGGAAATGWVGPLAAVLPPGWSGFDAVTEKRTTAPSSVWVSA